MDSAIALADAIENPNSTTVFNSTLESAVSTVFNLKKSFRVIYPWKDSNR
jgi:hypothetical protein